MAHEVPPLPYDYSALEPYIDTQTMHLHHDKHHQAYVTNLNAAIDKAPELAKLTVEDLIRVWRTCPKPSAPPCATTAEATSTTPCSGRS